MNKFQADVVANAMGDLKRAQEKVAMVATQLIGEASMLDGVERAAKAEKAIELFKLGGGVLLSIDRYTDPIERRGGCGGQDCGKSLGHVCGGGLAFKVSLSGGHRG